MNEDLKSGIIVNYDYDFLKKQGIEYIKDLAGKIWTDYNEHDPGITLLETLCFAIVDLEYRTNFFVEDLIAVNPNGTDTVVKQFYNAEEILPCNPIGKIDFLKLIVDIDGIKNAKIFTSNKIYEIKGGYIVYLEFEHNVIKNCQETEVTNNVRNVLYKHRNLCEDFFEIKALKPLDIIINVSVVLASLLSYEDSAYLKAQIFFKIQSFIAPRVKFYSLKEMLINKGYTVDKIYTGPLLLRGFVDDRELYNDTSRTVIYLSEILNVITKIKDIDCIIDINVCTESDKSISLTNIEIPFDAVLNLNLEQSTVNLYYNESAIDTNADLVKQHYTDLLNSEIFNKPYLIEDEINFPEGRYRNLSDYFSIQNDLPSIYGVGKENLPNSVSLERKLEAQHLKGYLMFFDQFFANYLSQLSQIKDLLAIQSDKKEVIFTQIPSEVPYISKLIKTPCAYSMDTYFVNETNTEFNIQRKYLGINVSDFDLENNFNTDYKEFVRDTYLEYLKKVSSVKCVSSFHKRGILDYLLGIFAESFFDHISSYVNLNNTTGYLIDELLENKQEFLKEYKYISKDRSKGVDITNNKNYESDNSGFKKRLSKLLGIRNPQKRQLYDIAYKTFYVKQKMEDEDPESDPIFYLQGNFPNLRELVFKYGVDSNNYTIAINSESKYDISLCIDKQIDKNITLVSKKSTINDYEEALATVRTYIAYLHNINAKSEGLYVVEHILLRDTICLSGQNDPYSFMLTIVFPSWPARFQDTYFRNNASDLILREAPAHILVNILWLDIEDMMIFEKLYETWINLKTNSNASEDSIKTATKNLLGIILLYSTNNE